MGWSNISDGRFKRNVQQNVRGLDFIMKLQPVTYQLDVQSISNYLNEGRGKNVNDAMKQGMSVKEKMIFSGFIAQDVEAVAKQLGFDFSGVDAPKSSSDLYSLRYADFVVPIIKAMQEQQQIIVEQKQLVNDQKQMILELQKRLEVLESKVK